MMPKVDALIKEEVMFLKLLNAAAEDTLRRASASGF